MSNHYDNPDVITYTDQVLVTAATETRVYAPPPGKTRGRLVSIQAAVVTSVVATNEDCAVQVGVSGDLDREGLLAIPDATAAGTGLSSAANATSVTQGFGFGQGNPNDQSVAAVAEDVHITTVVGTGGIVAGEYNLSVAIAWY